MLDREERKEMLEDAKSMRRRMDFEAAQAKKKGKFSLDDYLSFLDSVQKIFSPFKISRHPTLAKHNKL